MNDLEIQQYIHDLTPDTMLSDYELNILLGKAKNSKDLRSKLKSYEVQTHKSYTALPEWKNVEKLVSFADSRAKASGSPFYYTSKGTGAFFDAGKIIRDELKDYNITDLSQRRGLKEYRL